MLLKIEGTKLIELPSNATLEEDKFYLRVSYQKLKSKNKNVLEHPKHHFWGTECKQQQLLNKAVSKLEFEKGSHPVGCIVGVTYLKGNKVDCEFFATSFRHPKDHWNGYTAICEALSKTNVKKEYISQIADSYYNK